MYNEDKIFCLMGVLKARHEGILLLQRALETKENDPESLAKQCCSRFRLVCVIGGWDEDILIGLPLQLMSDSDTKEEFQQRVSDLLYDLGIHGDSEQDIPSWFAGTHDDDLDIIYDYDV